MGGSDKVVSNNNGAGGGGSSRWNPTKEQINMLEGLYKQGLRTPSAQQIQQITVRLRAFGHIEGKNVFYWFQNHKARQRQKQKQDISFAACYNRFIPVFQPNVVCRPCCNMPQPMNPKVALPIAAAAGVDFKRCRRLTINDEPMCRKSMHGRQKETLDLFPIHPTAKNGILESQSTKNDNTENNNTSTSSDDYNDCEKAGKAHHFFDFFCKN